MNTPNLIKSFSPIYSPVEHRSPKHPPNWFTIKIKETRRGPYQLKQQLPHRDPSALPVDYHSQKPPSSRLFPSIGTSVSLYALARWPTNTDAIFPRLPLSSFLAGRKQMRGSGRPTQSPSKTKPSLLASFRSQSPSKTKHLLLWSSQNHGDHLGLRVGRRTSVLLPLNQTKTSTGESSPWSPLLPTTGGERRVAAKPAVFVHRFASRFPLAIICFVSPLRLYPIKKNGLMMV